MNLSRESQSNVGQVCASCAPQPGQFAGQEPANFVGKIVKLGFSAINPISQQPTKEHMWVQVLEVKDDKLVGTLDNYPTLNTNVAYGDTLSFKVEEIEDVYEPN